MKKIFASILLSLLLTNMFCQNNDISIHTLNSIERGKYDALISKFHSVDTLSESEIIENQKQYRILMNMADSVNLIGNKEMAQNYYKAANQLFPDDCLSSSKINPMIDCFDDDLFTRAMQYYDKSIEFGYYINALESLILIYYRFPEHQLEIRKKIINVEIIISTK